MTMAFELPTNWPANVQVHHGAGRYVVSIGSDILASALEAASRTQPDARAALLVDENVWHHHAQRIRDALGPSATDPHIIPSGEKSKTFDRLQIVIAHLLAKGLDRQGIVLAMGGGVVNDLGGFAASIYKRGVDVIQVPTTLLAQVDSAIGGKTGINVPAGKNLVGSFWQPTAVICDVGLLDTLGERERNSGFAEVVKYGMIGAADFFIWLEKNAEHLWTDREIRSQMIVRCCSEKARFVNADERETGDRALLNFGHTFAHAFEAICQYDGKLLHGEAVALGMLSATAYSVRRGLCADDVLRRLKFLLAATSLPCDFHDLPLSRDSVDTVVSHMLQDKKNHAGALTLILCHRVGECKIERKVSLSPLRDFLGHILSPGFTF